MIRRACEKTAGATMCPSICCSAVNMMVSQSASSGSPEKSAISTGAPRRWRDRLGDQLGEAEPGAEHQRVRPAPGKTPSEPMIQSATPAVVPMMIEKRSCPRT